MRFRVRTSGVRLGLGTLMVGLPFALLALVFALVVVIFAVAALVLAVVVGAVVVLVRPRLRRRVFAVWRFLRGRTFVRAWRHGATPAGAPRRIVDHRDGP